MDQSHSLTVAKIAVSLTQSCVGCIQASRNRYPEDWSPDPSPELSLVLNRRLRLPLCTLAAKVFPVLFDCHDTGYLFGSRCDCHAGANMATHMVKVREDLLQKLIILSQETGKPMSDLIEEVLDWARQQSQLQRSRAS